MAHAALFVGSQSMTVWYDVACTWYDPDRPSGTPVRQQLDREPARPFSNVGMFNFTCERPILPEYQRSRLSTKRSLNHIEWGMPGMFRVSMWMGALHPALAVLMIVAVAHLAVHSLTLRKLSRAPRLVAHEARTHLVAIAYRPFGLALWLYLVAQALVVADVVVFPDGHGLAMPTKAMYVGASILWFAAVVIVPLRMVGSDTGKHLFVRCGLARRVLWMALLCGTGLGALAICGPFMT